MPSLKRVKINLDPPIKLDDEGYGELIGQIQEHMASGDAEANYQATSLIIEVEPVKGETTDAVESGEQNEEGVADQTESNG